MYIFDTDILYKCFAVIGFLALYPALLKLGVGLIHSLDNMPPMMYILMYIQGGI